MGHTVAVLAYMRLIYSHPQKWIHNKAYAESFYSTGSQTSAGAEEVFLWALGKERSLSSVNDTETC